MFKTEMKYEQYVTYEQALVLKDKGFPQDADVCDYGFVIKEFYSSDDYPTKYEVGDEYDLNNGYYVDSVIMRPTTSQVINWLRIEKGVRVSIVRDVRSIFNDKYIGGNKWEYIIEYGDPLYRFIGPYDYEKHTCQTKLPPANFVLYQNKPLTKKTC